MISRKLREALGYEEVAEKRISAEERPAFHLSPRTGWMNDPNGFSWHDGVYHLFYQYHPYSTQWGPMHWGHAVSADFLHWEYLPVALAPDELYDGEGCFSGSAVSLPDGKHLLMYTGVGKKQMENGKIEAVQTQCLACGDGVSYEKWKANPVLDADDLPEGASEIDFRDPKIWQEKDGSFRCVAGSLSGEKSGQILLFESADGFDWHFKSILCENKKRFGTMWECPDFFELDGKWLLITSPQDMFADGEYHSGNGTLCMVGSFDDESGKFLEESDQTLDFGIDFYAPQTLKAPDGRRIMIGWMQNWDSCNIRTEKAKWFGQMTIPREIFLKNGRVCQRPVKEIENLRGERTVYEDVVFQGEKVFPDVRGRKIDMELLIRPQEREEGYHRFTVRFAENEKFFTTLSFCMRDRILELDRSFSGTRRDGVHKRSCVVFGDGDLLKLRLILDRYSVEVFVGEGEQTMTMTFYTELSADKISFFADGQVCMNLVKYTLYSKRH